MADACAARYPSVLEFRVGGIYLAPGGAEAGAYWHGGDWSIEGGALVVQVANDRNVAYAVIAVSGDALTLQDTEGCRFTYRRER